jgi:Ca2+/H+ antiporter
MQRFSHLVVHIFFLSLFMHDMVFFCNLNLFVSLSFVTEQVAEHTNGTIGALLNATFGNAPELLIASAALRKGFYRVVQLAMLGSMLTNLLFVFGVSCLIGGLRWQVQELRITSGNVSVGMLLLSVAGSLLPATLILGGQLKQSSSSSSSMNSGDDDSSDGGVEYDDTSIITQGLSSSSDTPSLEELQFCRVNAFVMIFMYGCYLIFQLGTHKEEFDEEENVVQTANHNQLHLSPHFTSRHGRQPQRNAFCVWAVRRTRCFLRMSGSSNDNINRGEQGWVASPSITAERRGGGGSGGGGEINGGDVEMMYSDRLLRMIPRDDKNNNNSIRYSDDDEDESSSDEECLLPQNATLNQDRDNGYFDDYDTASSSAAEPRLRSRGGSNAGDHGARKQHSLSPRRDNNTQQQLHNNNNNNTSSSSKGKKKKKKNRTPGVLLPLGLAEPSETIQRGK